MPHWTKQQQENTLNYVQNAVYVCVCVCACVCVRAQSTGL